MEINIHSIETHRFLISIAVFLGMILFGIGINFVVQKKFKTSRLKMSLVGIGIFLGLKFALKINKVTGDTRYINAIIYLVLLYFVIKMLDYIFMDVYVKNSKFRIPKLMHDIAVAIIYFIVFFSVLKMQLEIDLTPLLTTSAVISMVLGLALQDTLSNFIAGVVIHIESPFKYGDWVLIDNIEGKIMEINWRTVKILTFSNDFLVIPNGAVVKDAIINFNYPSSNHLLILNLGISYDEAPNNVKRAAKEIAENINYVLKKPTPIINLVKYNDFSIDYEIKLWINDFGKKKIVEDEFYTKLWYKFRREDIKIPYPIREIQYTNRNVKEEKEIHEQDLLKIAKGVVILKEIPEKIVLEIVRKSTKELYGASEILFRQGAKGESFFIIYSGRVEVIINDEKIRELKAEDFFGEMSLLTGKERTATIVALEDTECMVLTKQKFSYIISQYPEIMENLSRVIANREVKNDEKNQKKLKNDTKFSEKIVAKEEKNLLNKIKKFFNI